MFYEQPETDFSQKEIRVESNLITKCRGCLKEETDMNYLFVKDEKNMTLAKIIEESIGYRISEEDWFSEYLCGECTKIIVNFVRFKKNFEEATDYFKSLSITDNIKPSAKDHMIEEVNNDYKDYLIAETENNQKKQPNFHKTEPDAEQCGTENSENYEKPKKLKKCSLCGENFRSKYQLLKHRRTIHPNNVRETLRRKKVSAKNSIKKSSEKSDIPVNNTNTPLEEGSIAASSKKYCKVCKNVFPDEDFAFHFESHKTHICNTCGHRFVRKADLTDHLEIHLDVNKYVCQHCGKAFKVRTVLNKHKKIHTNPREQICDICGQCFNARDTLKTHYKLKHIKSKDYQCNICGLAFTLKSTLEKHIERHNPNRERIYSCDLCNVSYKNKYNLSRHHVIKHTAFENRPTCEFCGKGYTQKKDLVKHLKKHHGQNANQEKDTKEREQIKLNSE